MPTLTRLQVLRIGQYFTRKYRFLSTSNGSVCRCGHFARHIISTMNYASQKRHKKPTKARLVVMNDVRARFPDRNKYWKQNPRVLDHCVVKIGPYVLDVTRRQLDPRCAHPHIQTLTQARREWRKVRVSRWRP